VLTIHTNTTRAAMGSATATTNVPTASASRGHFTHRCHWFTVYPSRHMSQTYWPVDPGGQEVHKPVATSNTNPLSQASQYVPAYP
jgi:hypothetical protein